MAHREQTRRGKRDAIAEFIHLNHLADLLHPEADEVKRFYRRYRIAYYVRPDGCVPCHVCQVDSPRSTPIYIQNNKVAGHCGLTHGKTTIVCDYKNCSVRFSNMEDKEKHAMYVHEKAYGWWIPN